jgi:hypothetical protein
LFGLNIEAAILRCMGNCSSFERSPRPEKKRGSEDFEVGRYLNQEPELVFGTKSLKVIYPDSEVTVAYEEIVEVELPMTRKPDYKERAAVDPSLRQIRLVLRSGATVTFPVVGGSSTWDVFGAHSLMYRITFFNRKIAET